MITIFGTTYFTIGAGPIVLALAAPLLFWFSLWLLRPNIEGKPRATRWLAVGGTTLALLLLTAVGLFWDVYLIGQRAKELCAETGLQISRTARARSFVGSTDIAHWSKFGFEFVESEFFGKDLFHVARDKGRALIGTYQSIGLLDTANHLTVLEPGKRAESFEYDPGAGIQVAGSNVSSALTDTIACLRTNISPMP